MGVRRTVADVEADFVKGLAFARTVMFNAQCAACVREVDFHGFNIHAGDAPRFFATVPFGGYEGKKGVVAVRRCNRALIFGWLPLTCSR
jgi:hypothetical protein